MKKVIKALSKLFLFVFFVITAHEGQASWWGWLNGITRFVSSRQNTIEEIEEDDVQPEPVQQVPQQNLYPVVHEVMQNNNEQLNEPNIPLAQELPIHQVPPEDFLEIINFGYRDEVAAINAGAENAQQLRLGLKDIISEMTQDVHVAEELLNRACPHVERAPAQWRNQVQPFVVHNQAQHLPSVVDPISLDDDVIKTVACVINSDFADAIATINNDQENGPFIRSSLVENLIAIGFEKSSIERALQSLIKPKVIVHQSIVQPEVLKGSIKVQKPKRECCICMDDENYAFEIPCKGSKHSNETGLCKDCFNRIKSNNTGSCPVCRAAWDNNKIIALINKKLL